MSFYIKPERNGDIDSTSITYRAGKAYPILRGDRFTKTNDDILQDGVVLIDNVCYHITNCEQGFKVYQGKEITDPVLKDWGAVVTKSNNSLFRLNHSRLDGELCDWLYDIVILRKSKEVMSWVYNYFKKLLKTNESISWLRLDKNDKVYRVAKKYKREFHN